jgi:DNA-binding transcriptional regulator YiaG
VPITTSADSDPIAEMVAQVRASRLPEPEERSRIREGAGVSRRAMARACGVTVATVIKWEAGSQPRSRHAAVYQAALSALEQVAS